jgi:hypothetical protein
MKKPTKALGLRKVLAVTLDSERAAQWSDPDFRRALCENLAEEAPHADRIVIFTATSAALDSLAPETYLSQEITQRIPVVPVPARRALPPLPSALPLRKTLRGAL